MEKGLGGDKGCDSVSSNSSKGSFSTKEQYLTDAVIAQVEKDKLEIKEEKKVKFEREE